MRRALLLLPLLLAFLQPLGVVGTPADPGPLVVAGPMLTPPNPAVYDALPFILQPDPRPLAVSPAEASEELIAVLVDFNDAVAGATPADIDALLFDPSPGAGSLNAFYRENSYDATQVVGASTGVWYRSDQSMGYYGGDIGGIDNANVPIYCLVVEAVLAADAGGLDFTQYDNDGDGEVDHLVVVHAGNGQETDQTNPNLIWSHHWAIVDARQCTNIVPRPSSANLFVDGIRVREYLLASETSPLGVFVHEFGHDFGLPDLYDTTGRTEGIGAWGVMGTGSWNGGGASPAHFTAWSKAQLGWLSLQVVAGVLAPASIPALAASPLGAFKLPIKDSFAGEEYFIVENRQPIGFDQGLPGSGLLIWHVDETVRNNDNPNRRLVDLEESDDDLGFPWVDNPTQDTDPWSNDPLGFTPDTFPNSNDNDGARTGWKVTGISPSRDLMQANMSIGVAVDLAIVEATRPSFVPLNQPVPVDVLITNRGLSTIDNGTLTFDVFFETYEIGARFDTQSRPLLPLAEGDNQTLSFAFTPDRAGTYLIETAALAAGDELPENNVRIVHVVAGQDLFLEDVEDDASVAQWSTSTDAGSAHRWQVVEDGGGFGTAYSPVRAWRFGDFGVGVPDLYAFYHLTSPEILLGSEVPRLLYHQRYQLNTSAVESGAGGTESDVASVSVSFDGGAQWDEVASFVGVRPDWERVYVDLAPLAQGAQRMQIRFTATAGIMPEEGGWWIDDVAVLRVPLAPMPLVKALENQKEVIPESTVSFLFLLVNVGDLAANFTFQVQGLRPDWDALIGRNETSAIPVVEHQERLAPDQQRALSLIVRAPLLAERGLLHQGVLTVRTVGEATNASFVFSVQVPVGFGFNLSGQTLILVLVIGGIMLALAIVLTALKRRRGY